MRKYDRSVSPAQLGELLKTYGPTLAGTLSAPPPFPTEFIEAGVRPRNPRWNGYRGMTITHPGLNSYLFGFTYDDWKDGQTDEDLYELDLVTKTLTFHPRGRYESLNPAYSGSHRGPKHYFPAVTRRRA